MSKLPWERIQNSTVSEAPSKKMCLGRCPKMGWGCWGRGGRVTVFQNIFLPKHFSHGASFSREGTKSETTQHRKGLWAVVSFHFNNMLGWWGVNIKISDPTSASSSDKKSAVPDGQMAGYYWPGHGGHIARICYPRRRLICYFATSWFVASHHCFFLIHLTSHRKFSVTEQFVARSWNLNNKHRSYASSKLCPLTDRVLDQYVLCSILELLT